MSGKRVSDESLLSEYEKHVTDVASMMRRTYQLDMSDQEDLEQELRIKLLAIPQQHRGHRQYVKTCLNNRARDCWRCLKRYQSRTTAILDDDSPSDLRHDTNINGERHVSALLAPLTLLQRQIVSAHLGLDGDTPAKLLRVARDLGIPVAQAQAELDTALAVMREVVSPSERVA